MLFLLFERGGDGKCGPGFMVPGWLYAVERRWRASFHTVQVSSHRVCKSGHSDRTSLGIVTRANEAQMGCPTRHSSYSLPLVSLVSVSRLKENTGEGGVWRLGLLSFPFLPDMVIRGRRIGL